jgi:hypothetical protein
VRLHIERCSWIMCRAVLTALQQARDSVKAAAPEPREAGQRTPTPAGTVSDTGGVAPNQESWPTYAL